MEYQFKKFEERNVRLEDRVTITRSNQIGFPTKFYQDNGIKNFKYVVLFWDQKNKAIGIHFTNAEEQKSTFSIIHNKKYGGNAAVRSFFRINNIDPKIYYGRYNWKKHKLEEVGSIFVIELKERKTDQKATSS